MDADRGEVFSTLVGEVDIGEAGKGIEDGIGSLDVEVGGNDKVRSISLLSLSALLSGVLGYGVGLEDFALGVDGALALEVEALAEEGGAGVPELEREGVVLGKLSQSVVFCRARRTKAQLSCNSLLLLVEVERLRSDCIAICERVLSIS